jgi:hypothetical protein
MDSAKDFGIINNVIFNIKELLMMSDCSILLQTFFLPQKNLIYILPHCSFHPFAVTYLVHLDLKGNVPTILVTGSLHTRYLIDFDALFFFFQLFFLQF